MNRNAFSTRDDEGNDVGCPSVVHSLYVVVPMPGYDTRARGWIHGIRTPTPLYRAITIRT